MNTPRILLITALLALTSFAMLTKPTVLTQPASNLQKITAVLVVDKIEPSIPFFVERLGFKMTMSLPEGDAIGFAILESEGVELMMQTHSGINAENPNVGTMLKDSVQFLYLEVDDIDAIERAMKGADIAIPKKTTFYGATELGIREPGGHVLVFAEFAAEESE